MNRKLVLLGLFTAMAGVFYAVESWINLPIPWFRLGLANTFTVLVLDWWGVGEAMVLVVTRSILGCVLTGRLFHPDMAFSLVGGIVSALAMALLMRVGSRSFGYVGVSIVGALTKKTVQLVLAVLLFVRHGGLATLLPLFIACSLASGLVIGLLAIALNRALRTAVPDLRRDTR